MTTQQVLRLPDSPRALREALLVAPRALNRRQLEAYVQSGPYHDPQVARLLHGSDGRDQLAFEVLDGVSSLAISPISDALRRCLVIAATLIPGVHTSTSGTRLALTVPGVNFGGPVVFDRRMGRLLQGMPQAPGTIIAQGVVASIGVQPHRLPQIQARHLLTPAIPRLTPSTGTAHTSFTLKLPARAIGATTAPSVWADMTGPTGPNCHYQDSQPGTARIPTGTSHGRVDIFTVAPRAIGRDSWCSGRYGLRIAAGKDATLGTGQGSTVYFTIR